jgi:amino acid transporter
VWLGGLAVFSFIVAPAAFSVLPSRHLAGDLVSASLARLYLLSVLCAAVFAAALVMELAMSGNDWRAAALPAALLVLALVIGSYNHYGLTPPMAGLRAEMKSAFGSVDQTPADHPLRVRFNRLHGISMALLSGELLLLAGLVFVTVRRFR